MKNFFNIDDNLLRNAIILLAPKSIGERSFDVCEGNRFLNIKIKRIQHFGYDIEGLFLYLFFRDKDKGLSFRITYHIRVDILNDLFYKNNFSNYMLSENIVTGNKRYLMMDNKNYIENNINNMLKEFLKK